MGFKYQKFSFVSGSSEYSSGTTATDIRTKEEYLVKNFAQAIIDCNCGWALDTNRHSSITDFFDVKKIDSSTDAPGLFLVNSTSGCKLFIAYLTDSASGGLAFLDTDGTTKIYKNEFVSTVYHSSRPSANTSIQGLIMSMIPAGSSSEFGQTCNVSFLPSDATRLYGSASNAAANIRVLTLCYLGRGATCYVQVFATPYCVGFGASPYNNEAATPLYFCGRIMGDLLNTSDNTNQAKYGIFTIRRTSAASSSSSDYISDIAQTTWNGGSFNLMNSTGSYSTYWSIGVVPGGYVEYSIAMSTGSPSRNSPFCGNCICKADGSWVSNTAAHGIAACVNHVLTLSTAVYNSSSNNRPWQPIAICVFSNDSSVDGVIPGVGFKGYLDTDLFRFNPQLAAGTVLDNGNFVCTDVLGITLGWDPSNESW